MRPICVHCGKAYGHRKTEDHIVKWPMGEPMPPYRGNGIAVNRPTSYVTSNRQNVAYVSIWDGETYSGGYKPFCTLRCALDYARKAYRRRQFRGSAPHSGRGTTVSTGR